VGTDSVLFALSHSQLTLGGALKQLDELEERLAKLSSGVAGWLGRGRRNAKECTRVSRLVLFLFFLSIYDYYYMYHSPRPAALSRKLKRPGETLQGLSSAAETKFRVASTCAPCGHACASRRHIEAVNRHSKAALCK
jgi:hypothetical protein